MDKTDRDSLFVRGLAGEKSLRGSLSVNPAKNAILKAMSASILFEDEVTLVNVPHIEDVSRMAELLRGIGASVEREDRICRISTSQALSPLIDKELSGHLRASVVLSGPLLARLGEVSFPHPGGCVIGTRPIDLFLENFEKLGASVSHRDDHYHIETKGNKLRGAEIFFRVQSHTATETMMMAAVLAEGKTILKNCALEPEVKDLADFLNTSGAHISGAGTSTIEVEGGGLLRRGGKSHQSLPDRIEAGSFLILGALCADELEITNCNPSHIEILVDMLRRSGVSIVTQSDKIILSKNGAVKNSSLKAIDVKTHEYPGFATDLQAPMVVYLTQASGESLVFETIFEGRLNYINDLVRMGADISTWDSHRVTVKGPTSLVGRALGSPDLRAGLAFTIAAAVAKGNSLIDNVYYIDRGYESIEKRLREIGLDIERRNKE